MGDSASAGLALLTASPSGGGEVAAELAGSRGEVPAGEVAGVAVGGLAAGAPPPAGVVDGEAAGDGVVFGGEVDSRVAFDGGVPEGAVATAPVPAVAAGTGETVTGLLVPAIAGVVSVLFESLASLFFAASECCPEGKSFK